MNLSIDQQKITSFLYKESRLLDEHKYIEWEKLWDDDNTLYWIPAGLEGSDPEKDVQFIYDNRHRLSTRVKKYLTGMHYAQDPESRTQHYLSNIDIINCLEDIISIEGSLLVIECRMGQMNFWPGKVSYKLKKVDQDYKIVEKKFQLINSDDPIPTLGFIV